MPTSTSQPSQSAAHPLGMARSRSRAGTASRRGSRAAQASSASSGVPLASVTVSAGTTTSVLCVSSWPSTLAKARAAARGPGAPCRGPRSLETWRRDCGVDPAAPGARLRLARELGEIVSVVNGALAEPPPRMVHAVAADDGDGARADPDQQSEARPARPHRVRRALESHQRPRRDGGQRRRHAEQALLLGEAGPDGLSRPQPASARAGSICPSRASLITSSVGALGIGTAPAAERLAAALYAALIVALAGSDRSTPPANGARPSR